MAETFDVEECNRLLGIVPLFTSRWVTVRCGACRRSFGSSRPAGELARMPKASLSAMLADWQMSHVGFLTKFCVILSLVLGILPYFGLPFGIIAVLATFKRRTRWRTAAMIGLALSLLVSIALSLFLLLSKTTGNGMNGRH